jgi:uncharacterized spore protein YtfJ
MTQAIHNDAGVVETIREVVEATAAEKVFGTPITHNGMTVLPVAKVSGGGGGGGGTGPMEEGREAGGTGGGIGVSAKPLGVFVIKEKTVRWRPVVDINKALLGGQAVAVMALLTIRTLIKARGRRRKA